MSGLHVLAAAGSTETTTATPGAMVRRSGYRRLWRVTGNTGQLVHLEAAGRPPKGHQRHRTTVHAGDLYLVSVEPEAGE